MTIRRTQMEIPNEWIRSTGIIEIMGEITRGQRGHGMRRGYDGRPSMRLSFSRYSSHLKTEIFRLEPTGQQLTEWWQNYIGISDLFRGRIQVVGGISNERSISCTWTDIGIWRSWTVESRQLPPLSHHIIISYI
jgi:hypothetical protein